MTQLIGLVYAAAHVTASVFSTFLCLWMEDLEALGPRLWWLAGLPAALLLADLSGCARLRSWWAALAAGLALPLTCSGVDVLLREGRLDPSPGLWGLMTALLALEGYLLLRTPRTEGPEPVRYAAAGAAAAVWLLLLGSALVLMLTYGLLLSLIVGGLLAGSVGLLDYEGVAGLALGIGALCLLQALWVLTDRRPGERKTDPRDEFSRF